MTSLTVGKRLHTLLLDHRTAQSWDDPSSHVALNSAMNFSHRMSFEASLRCIGALPDPSLPHYDAFDPRVGWQATEASSRRPTASR